MRAAIYSAFPLLSAAVSVIIKMVSKAQMRTNIHIERACFIKCTKYL